MAEDERPRLDRVVSTTQHAQMASFSRRRLVCFGCNKRSSIKYDGHIRQWECAECKSMNYLDERGEITDPPVATESLAPDNRPWTVPESDIPYIQASTPERFHFCAQCLKNQHLYTASLRQYEVETDPYNPNYRASEKEYYKFKKDLERRYPQVCEDCYNGAEKEIVRAGRLAAADHGRILRERTRLRAEMSYKDSIVLWHRSITVWVVFGLISKILFYLGVLGQLLWNLSAVLSVVFDEHMEVISEHLPSYAITTFGLLISLFNNLVWARRSLLCSLMVSWWSPNWWQWFNGYSTHLVGNTFQDWYKFQTVSIVARLLCYCFMQYKSNTDPGITISTHVGSAAFVLLLTWFQQYSQKVNPMRLFNLKGVDFKKAGVSIGPGLKNNSPETSETPTQESEPYSMSNAINQIATNLSRRSQLPVSPLTPPQENSYGKSHTYYEQSSYHRTPSPPMAQSYGYPNFQTTLRQPDLYQHDEHLSQAFQQTGFLSDSSTPRKSQRHLSERLESRSFQSTRTGPLFPEMELYKASIGQEMEWTPTRPVQSEHRAFQSLLPDQPKNQLFGQTPTTTAENASVFWAKVPPAPITPAHRLRNPPNQPRLRVSSQEVKENFFKQITQRSPTAYDGSMNNDQRRLEFAQQRFFAPEKTNDEADAVTAMFSKWDLSPSPEPQRARTTAPATRPIVWKHFVRCIFLGLGFWFWHNVSNFVFIDSWNCMMGVLVLCLCMATWIILNYTHVSNEERKKNAFHTFGALFGGVLFMAILWLMTKLHSERDSYTQYAPHGELVIGLMAIHELGLALFAGEEVHRVL